MIRNVDRLRALERAFAHERLSSLTYPEALAIFTGLWREALALNADFPGDWRADLEPDLAVARAVNGLPPRS
ncbi:MAG: hypothetical protein L0271_12290 [Gemmatimonadetes bacterium]|nr:hypothetical protein [Gemmatimonadota bacterium]